MEKRKQNILKAVIKEYQGTAQPVSSQILFERYHFHIRPATIRLGMAELTEEGYFCQPHISAGRIPTDKAYQFFVEELIEERPLNKSEKKKLQNIGRKIKNSHLNIPRKIVENMALLSHSLGMNKEENDFYEFGLNWLLREPEFSDRQRFIDLVDSLSEVEEIFNRAENGLKILIGQKTLGPKLKDCSLIVNFLESPSSKNRSAVGILGPRRMNYAKNISLVEYASKILENF